jgi:hypothetical protein
MGEPKKINPTPKQPRPKRKQKSAPENKAIGSAPENKGFVLCDVCGLPRMNCDCA